MNKFHWSVTLLVCLVLGSLLVVDASEAVLGHASYCINELDDSFINKYVSQNNLNNIFEQMSSTGSVELFDHGC